jgi:hypothetical protein
MTSFLVWVEDFSRGFGADEFLGMRANGHSKDGEAMDWTSFGIIAPVNGSRIGW